MTLLCQYEVHLRAVLKFDFAGLAGSHHSQPGRDFLGVMTLPNTPYCPGDEPFEGTHRFQPTLTLLHAALDIAPALHITFREVM